MSRRRSNLLIFLYTCVDFGGMLFTFSVGWLVMHIGYSPVFVIIAFLDLIGAVILWTLIREPKQEMSFTPSQG